VCIVICVALLVALSLATLIHLGLFASMRLDVVGVFCRALALLPPAHEPPPNIGFLDAFVSDTLMRLTIFLPFFILMAFAVWRSGVWERRVIREELAEEVGRTVSPGEYQEIVGDRMLRTRRIDRIQRRASAALINAQHELAFRKRRVRNDGEDPELDSLVAGGRDEIRRLQAAV